MPKKSTERALVECRRRSWPAGLVERSVPTGGNQFIRTKIDFMGFADVLALDEMPGVLAIQACVGNGDAAKHVTKLSEIAALRTWLTRGNRCEIWSFRRVKVKRGGVAIRWALRRLVAEIALTGIAFPEACEKK